MGVSILCYEWVNCLQHKEIHQFTWECRSRGLKSILDYFLVRREDRRRVKDTKVARRAEISSDHYLGILR